MKYKNLLLILLGLFTLTLYAQDADLSLIPYRQGDLWGYATGDKQIFIKPEYNEANLFYEGLASVKKGKLYGYIDKFGKVVIPFKFYAASAFRFGYFDVGRNANPGDGPLNTQKKVLFAGAAPLANGIEICIDTKGNKLAKCPAISDSNLSDNSRQPLTTSESNYSTIQKSDLFDKITGDYKMPGNEDTYYIAIRNNNYGVFNNKFEVIIPFEYTLLKKLNSSSTGVFYLTAEKNGLKGVLSGDGSPYIAVDNNNLLYINAINGKDYFIVSKNGKAGVKDAGNNDFIPSGYTDIHYDEEGGFVLFGNGDLKGFCFLNRYILEPKYTDVKAVKGGGYVIVRTLTGKPGFVNNRGDEFFVE